MAGSSSAALLPFRLACSSHPQETSSLCFVNHGVKLKLANLPRGYSVARTRAQKDATSHTRQQRSLSLLAVESKIRMVYSLNYSPHDHSSVMFKRLIQLLPPLARIKLNHFCPTSLYQSAADSGVFSRSLQPRLAGVLFAGE